MNRPDFTQKENPNSLHTRSVETDNSSSTRTTSDGSASAPITAHTHETGITAHSRILMLLILHTCNICMLLSLIASHVSG